MMNISVNARNRIKINDIHNILYINTTRSNKMYRNGRNFGLAQALVEATGQWYYKGWYLQDTSINYETNALYILKI